MIDIRSPHLTGAEVAWFAPLCGDDYEFLGVPENQYKSNWANTSNVLLTADKLERLYQCPVTAVETPDGMRFHPSFSDPAG